MSVTTGLIVSLAKPFPFLWSSHLRFVCELVRCSSASSFGVGVGAVLGADDGAAGGDGEHHLGGKSSHCLCHEAHVFIHPSGCI